MVFIDPLPKAKNITFALISLFMDLYFPGLGMLFHQITGETDDSWLRKTVLVIIGTTLSMICCLVVIGIFNLVILWIITLINNIAIINECKRRKK
jgi:hypothetical protein